MTRILVIDRDGVSRRLAARVLEQAGRRVAQGSCGCEAAGLARRHRPGLVLMGVDAQAEEVLRALRCLRAEPVMSGVRVHALVARGLAPGHARMLADEFDGFLVKPFDQRGLFRYVDAQLRRRP